MAIVPCGQHGEPGAGATERLALRPWPWLVARWVHLRDGGALAEQIVDELPPCGCELRADELWDDGVALLRQLAAILRGQAPRHRHYPSQCCSSRGCPCRLFRAENAIG